MDDQQLLRYNRQIMLPDIGIEGQQRLLDARVLVIGMGGLGSPLSMYLAASGVGELVIVDHDQVELSNLQRQIVHNSASLNMDKVVSAGNTLRALNPEITVTQINHSLSGDELLNEVGQVAAVVDATDNFAARFEINRACLRQSTPLISGAVIRMEGQVSVFRFDRPDSPCYHCLYGDVEEPPETCATNGVLGSVAGIIGCIQATETVKVLLNIGETLAGRLLLLDALNMEWRSIRLAKDPHCPICAAMSS